MNARVIHGDCTVILRQLFLAGVRVDAVCTDAPYHLASIVARLGQPDSAPIQSGTTGVYARSSQGFMGQQWDGGDVAFRPETWRRVFEVIKPGAYLVAFAATKGYHRMACAIEDAGFEIRDMLSWLYGTGFPKSHNLDGEHEGKGTALKPAVEPIVFAQKPISEGSVLANTARWGVGAINIDACRIPTDEELKAGAGKLWSHYRAGTEPEGQDPQGGKPGRWPANLLHDGSVEVLEAFAAYGERGALAPVGERAADKCRNVYNGSFKGNGDNGASFQGDSGTAARFFYSSKATQGERIFECRECGAHTIGKPSCGHTDLRTHPTVKPISLMEWLVKLVCPAGGLVLDPFAGTGTTAAAARAAGMQSLSIEADENHVRDIAVRLGLDLSQITTAEVAALPVENGSQMDMFA
ncbi:site-specific DNA-methyltransferase (adenine-specific) [Novosphingobium sp. PhB55]|uniref:DNA methyltransferase n=1 Tax=Novosphingobium sp. PhB55 TaxID=2485106 RepID=UPI001064BEED|nr:DNA methyltransferase [Novosphingobium sp. PhB55]TDW65383.1 site-specific DNA-methyltransferase (adenine-specific) [Novosphingobium sp. PhB55]